MPARRTKPTNATSGSLDNPIVIEDQNFPLQADAQWQSMYLSAPEVKTTTRSKLGKNNAIRRWIHSDNEAGTRKFMVNDYQVLGTSIVMQDTTEITGGVPPPQAASQSSVGSFHVNTVYQPPMARKRRRKSDSTKAVVTKARARSTLRARKAPAVTVKVEETDAAEHNILHSPPLSSCENTPQSVDDYTPSTRSDERPPAGFRMLYPSLPGTALKSLRPAMWDAVRVPVVSHATKDPPQHSEQPTDAGYRVIRSAQESYSQITESSSGRTLSRSASVPKISFAVPGLSWASHSTATRTPLPQIYGLSRHSWDGSSTSVDDVPVSSMSRSASPLQSSDSEAINYSPRSEPASLSQERKDFWKVVLG